jgi:hypothetical protein
MKILSSVGFLVAGLAIGIIVGKGPVFSPTAHREGSEPAPARTRSAGQDRSASSGSRVADIKRIRQAAPSELAGLTQQAASISDPLEMRLHLTECLLNITADNWQEVVASFHKLSVETGRDWGDEWRLSLVRSGQVAGANAMDSCLSAGLKNRSQESWSILYGWGTKDPRAALAWLKNAEADGHETANGNYTAVIAGAALSNPKDALNLLAEIPAQCRKDCAGHLIWNVVQNGGVDALNPILQYASTLNASDPNNAQFANDLFHEVGEKLLWKADHALDVGQACDVVLKLTQYGQDPTSTTYRALQKFRYYNVPDKLNIIETIRTAPQQSELNLPFLASAVVNTMNGDRDVSAVREWMGKNPNSPLIPYLQQKVAGNP